MSTMNDERPPVDAGRVDPQVMRRFWISWIQKTEDERPLSFPPNPAILGWWCSGYDGLGNPILCAAVQASDQDEAERAIGIDWPENERSSRFFEERATDWIPGDRFPLSDWMKERFGVAA